MSNIKAIAKALLSITIGLVPIWLISMHVADAVELAFQGKDSVGHVTQYVPRKCGRAKYHKICHFHVLGIDGRNVEFDLGREYPIGTSISITYLPSDPAVSQLGSIGGSPFAFIRSKIGIIEIIVFGVGLYWIWIGIRWLLVAKHPTNDARN